MMSRRRSSKSNIAAGIAGAKEVAAELSGNTAEARRDGMREKMARDGSSRSRGQRSPGIRGNAKYATYRDTRLAQPYQIDKPIIATTYSGRTFGTDVPADRILTDRGQAYLFAYEANTMSLSPNSVTPPTGIANYQAYLNQFYPLIVRELLEKQNFYFRDPVLTTPNNFTAFLDQIFFPFLIVRSLEACLNSGNYNYTTSLMASAVQQNESQFRAVKQKLMSIPMPQLLVDLWDRLCGIKALDGNAPLHIYTVMNTLGTVPDLTVPATVLSLINTAQTGINAALVGTTDFQQCINVFARAFGPASFPTKGIEFDTIAYDFIYNYCFTFTDSTGAKHYTAPNGVTLNPLCPILVRKGFAGKPEAQILFTFLRPAPFDFKDAEAISSATIPSKTGIGVFSNSSTGLLAYDSWNTYFQTGAATQFNMTAAGLGNYNVTSPAYNFPWASFAGQDPATTYSGAIGTGFYGDFADFDLFWVSTDNMIDQTYYEVQRIFLESVRSSIG